MNILISEQQRHIIHQFIDDLLPNIGKLKKRPTKSMSFGRGYKFFDPQSKEVLFHLVSGGPVFWEKGGNTRPSYPGVRLYVDSKIYNELNNYFGNADEQLLKWFNEKYKQNADRVIGGVKR